MNRNKQTGFTLVEIAIVLVIIGLLLGGILKGQELINSARVRNLADMNSGIQAAYYGFIDRYRHVAGDWLATEATVAIGQTINLPTLGAADENNGRIDNDLEEAAAAWEQLSKAGFIQGAYDPAAAPADDSAYIAFAPINAFNGAVTLTRNADYSDPAASDRLNLHLGINIPVNISRELDVKVDDGRPLTGILRLSTASAPWTNLHAVSAAPVCTVTVGLVEEYNITEDAQDCGVAFLY